MSNSSYVSRLEALVEEFIDMFEYDLASGVYTYENEDGEMVTVSEKHLELILHANDLIYEVEPDGAGYPTEEEEG